jgi:hypothetical protein
MMSINKTHAYEACFAQKTSADCLNKLLGG